MESYDANIVNGVYTDSQRFKFLKRNTLIV